MNANQVKKAIAGAAFLQIEAIQARLPKTYQPRVFSPQDFRNKNYLTQFIEDLTEYCVHSSSGTNAGHEHVQYFSLLALNEGMKECNRESDISDFPGIQNLWQDVISLSLDDANAKILEYFDTLPPPKASL